MGTIPKFGELQVLGLFHVPQQWDFFFLGVLGAAPGAISALVNFTQKEKVTLAALHLPQNHLLPQKPSPKAALTPFLPFSTSQESGMDELG